LQYRFRKQADLRFIFNDQDNGHGRSPLPPQSEATRWGEVSSEDYGVLPAVGLEAARTRCEGRALYYATRNCHVASLPP
jgi:hypothetical protein